MAAQAQKHITHNEALQVLDTTVQLSVLNSNLSTPPGSPVEGDRHIVASGATGEWSGKDQQVSVWQEGTWISYAPREGWLAWDRNDELLLVFDGTAWVTVVDSDLQNVALVGINATADTTNRLSVSSPATLLSHEGNDHQVKVNKNASADTASFLFQTDFSGRAELGTTGDDSLHFKVSADGTNWTEALFIDNSNGYVGIGTTTPSQPLNILKDDASTHYVKVESVQAQNAGFQFVTPNTTWYAYNQNSTSQWRFYNNATRLAIAATGEIGIGTTTLPEKLNVAGNIAPSVNNTYDLGTSLKRWDDVYATNATIQTSDARSKEDIETLPYGLDLITALRPVQFKWKDHAVEVEEENDTGEIQKQQVKVTHSRLHFGLVAQEVAALLETSNIPTNNFAALVHDAKTDSYGMRYGELIPLLIKGLQEITERVKHLENLEPDTKNC